MIKQHMTPKKGLIVLNPRTGKALPVEGEVEVLTIYWQRRVADGDVIATVPKLPRKTKPKSDKEA